MLKNGYNKSTLEKKYRKVIDGSVVNSISTVMMKDISKYVPEDSGKLKDSLKYDARTGAYTWDTKYAKLLWHGKTKDGKQIHFNRNKSPKAGPRWVNRYLDDNSDKIKEEIVKEMKR